MSSRIQRVPRVGSTDCSRPSRKSGRWADDAALVNASENVVGRGIELAGVVAPDGEVLCNTAYTLPLVGPTRKRFPSDGVLTAKRSFITSLKIVVCPAATVTDRFSATPPPAG